MTTTDNFYMEANSPWSVSASRDVVNGYSEDGHIECQNIAA